MNSLPELQSVAAIIETSLSTLKQECPEAHHKLCLLLAPHEITLAINDEVMRLIFAVDTISIINNASSSSTQVQFQTTRQTILNLVDGHTTFNRAVLDGELQMYGQISDIADFYDGFLLYLHGAVRCPSFPALLEQFRQLA